MTFPHRLQELCERGEGADAVTLAKANLRHARDVGVDVDGSTVVVETDHFRGTHQWSVDPDGAPVIDPRGQYTCTIDGVRLSLSTATMNRRAHDRARAALEERLGLAPVMVVGVGGPAIAEAPADATDRSEGDTRADVGGERVVDDDGEAAGDVVGTDEGDVDAEDENDVGPRWQQFVDRLRR